ncbi:hypothetical protein [Brachybacterium vulturis]|uniref:hypothetical protein n=1 Tax=Brachybacterium vulturis TaxID=2017484 RepID=UPI0012FE769A|nr:hypothetical protein [Brachybacterium vulturis]
MARPAIQRQIAGVGLTKTAWCTPMRQVLRVIGVKFTKESFAKIVTKAVPVAELKAHISPTARQGDQSANQ